MIALTDVPIHAIGGTGVFAKEVQQTVLDGRADVAVHSAKDLPASDNPDGLMIAAVPERADPRDALVGSTLAALPAGARVATGSVRRRAQLVSLRPDLTFAELRGNIATRLARAADYDAIVVAAAALVRLGLDERADELLEPSVMLPQVGQGALAVECRADDAATLERLRHRDRRSRLHARSAPNAPTSPSSAAAATCRAARSPRSSETATGTRSRSRRCSRRPTATSCCGRRRGTDPVVLGRARGARPARPRRPRVPDRGQAQQ